MSAPLDKELLIGPCVLWGAYVSRKGYGFGWNGKCVEQAHRIAYRQAGGEIPPGHDIHHRCENKRCVNPDHLVALPHGEHSKLHPRRRLTECRNGHAFTVENTGRDTEGAQTCRTCAREATRRYRAKLANTC